MTDKEIEQIGILALKEQLLSEIIVWLKAKGFYEQASRDITLLPELKKEK